MANKDLDPTRPSTSETAGEFSKRSFPSLTEERRKQLYDGIRDLWYKDPWASTTLHRAKKELATTDDEVQFCVHIITAFIFK